MSADKVNRRLLRSRTLHLRESINIWSLRDREALFRQHTITPLPKSAIGNWQSEMLLESPNMRDTLTRESSQTAGNSLLLTLGGWSWATSCCCSICWRL